MTGSLAYRKNEAAIVRGDIPNKYLRLLQFIPGTRILEIGSAEGVLALLLARQGRHVTALEKSEERHHSAMKLYAQWAAREEGFEVPNFVNGDIADNLWTLQSKDTLVAVRMIYYLGDRLDQVFADVAKHVPAVVLCGNRNRAESWRSGASATDTKADNYYASLEGMTDLLTRHGYRVTKTVREGDEIVVGER